MTQIVSSISGIEIYAPSAGNAPTNSADVSAIASAYQVVSSTGTQLYAGTSFLTGVNNAPVSASRAGQAANASMANSAYYDGTGRLISSLPDSASVSSIASSYAEAAASSKLDTTAFNSGDFYSTSNPSGFITGVDLSPYQEKTAMTAYAYESSNSAKLDSTAFSTVSSTFLTSVDLTPYQTTAGMTAYAFESSNSAKLDSTAFSDVSGTFLTSETVTSLGDDGTYITSINGSGLSGAGGGGAAFPAEIKTGSTLKAVVTTGFQDNTATRPTLFISSNPAQTAYPRMMLSENHTNTSQGKSAAFLADAFEFYTGNGSKVFRADRTSVSAAGQFDLESALVSGGNAGNGSTASRWFLNRNGVSGKTGTATWQYTTAEYGMLTSVHDTVSANSATWGGGGGVVTSTASASAGDPLIPIYYVNKINGSGLFAVSSEESEFAQYDTNGRLLLEIPGSAEVSAIASAYSESAASSKLDSSASSSFYTTANESGFITGVDLTDYATTGYVDSSVSGKADSSALSSYALSADVSGVIDTVSSNSATWGAGASLPITGAQGDYSASHGISSVDFTYGEDGGASNLYTGSINVSSIEIDFTPDNDEFYSTQLTHNYLNFTGPNHNQSMGPSEIEYWNDVANTVSTESGNWGGVDEATVSSIASSYAESSVSSKADSSALSSYALSSDVSGVIDTVSSNSASWGQGGVDSATVSAIASSYADNCWPLSSTTINSTARDINVRWGNNEILIGKKSNIDDPHIEMGVGGFPAKSAGLQSTRVFGGALGNATYRSWSLDVSGVRATGGVGAGEWQYGSAEYGHLTGVYDTVSSNSASWGQGGVDSATVSSIASSYAQDVSAAVSGTVDTVSSQSANWGGSALALSAGPGVKLEKVGDTLVAGLDETVLWSGTTTNITGITLNETYGNFDRVRFYWKPWSDAVAWHVTEIPSFALVFTLDAGWASNAGTGKGLFMYSISSNGTEFSQIQGGYQNITGSNTWSSATNCSVVKVVGVNRTAGV